MNTYKVLEMEYSMLGEFTGMLYNKYIDYSNPIEISENEIQFDHNFPTDKNEMPSMAYKKEWDEFNKKIWKNTYLKNKFLSNLRLYYKDEEFKIDISKMDNDLVLCHQKIAIFVHSKNKEKFEQNYKKIQSKREVILKSIKNIESRID